MRLVDIADLHVSFSQHDGVVQAVRGVSFNPITGTQEPQPGNSSAVPGTPLTPGQLIAACQAVSPQSTLRGAFSRFNSGSGIPVGGS